MITVLTGENDFEVDRALKRILQSFNGAPEKVDGAAIELRQLPDLLMGTTLFATKRLVIIKDLSLNKTVWADFTGWLPRLSDDVQLVLIETKIDKRTKTYKDLQKVANITDFKVWTEHDGSLAEKWVISEAHALSFTLDAKSAHALILWVGVDQWSLYHALQKLAVLDEVSPMVIKEFIEANPIENVFNLFEAALKGDAIKITEMIGILSITEDPYRLFGLLSGQTFQLMALTTTAKSDAEVAKDLGVHPFALNKLSRYAKAMGRSGAKRAAAAFIEADSGMKTSVAEPWLLIERALLKITQL